MGSGNRVKTPRSHQDDSEESGVGHEEDEEMQQLLVELLSLIRTPKVIFAHWEFYFYLFFLETILKKKRLRIRKNMRFHEKKSSCVLETRMSLERF